MKITVEIKMVYGNERIYPICDKALLLAKLAGSVTLTRASIDIIKKLGYEIVVQGKTL